MFECSMQRLLLSTKNNIQIPFLKLSEKQYYTASVPILDSSEKQWLILITRHLSW